jgi:hypothetical protein
MLNYVVTTCGEEHTFELVYELVYQMAENIDDISSLYIVMDSSKIKPNSEFYDEMVSYIEDTCYDISGDDEKEFETLFSKIYIEPVEFKGNFADFKNEVHKSITKGEYVVQIDADEDIDSDFTYELIPVLGDNDVDLIFLARENIVDGITDEYIKKMGWVLDKDGLVNYPDYQGRVYKLLRDEMWKGKVHERVEGVNNVGYTDKQELRLIHLKTFEKQKKQNELYNNL